MACLTAEQLELLVREALEPDAARALRAHLAQCPACRAKLEECQAHEKLADKLRGMGAAAELESPGEPESGRTTTVVDDSRTLGPSAVTYTDATADGTVSGSTVALPARDAFPGYEVLGEISRGGQGVVYRAYQLGTKREVAIKVLRDGSTASDADRRRFEREIEMVGQLNHPHIVTIFQPGVTGGGVDYFVMDYVPGLSLDRYVRTNQLPLEEVLRLLATVCEAVQYAHQRGVIHRDLKPSNILVDAEGQPKILDFGLARQLSVTESELTTTGQILGTLQYMSPEQARGSVHEINTLTDVYALGVILYRLLAGRFPYSVDGPSLEVLSHIVHSPPTALSKSWSPESGVRLRYRRRPARGCPIDKDVETIVLHALQKEQPRRYQSAGELARDIGHYLAGEPIEARRDSTWYVLRKLARRHLAATITVASVFVIAVSSAFISWFYYRDASRALAAQTASKQRLAEQGRTFDAAHEGIAAAVQRLSLGWFLRDWEAGRLESARQILAQTPAHLPEQAVMRFLLDPGMSPEKLISQVPAEAKALACFAAGERAWQAGRAAEAKHWYELCVDNDESGRIVASAKARLRQMAPGDASTMPAGLGNPGAGE